MGFDKRSEKDVALTSINNLLLELRSDGIEVVETSNTNSEKIIIHEGGSTTTYADSFATASFLATKVGYDGTIVDEEDMDYADVDVDTLTEIEELLSEFVEERRRTAKKDQ